MARNQYNLLEEETAQDESVGFFSVFGVAFRDRLPDARKRGPLDSGAWDRQMLFLVQNGFRVG